MKQKTKSRSATLLKNETSNPQETVLFEESSSTRKIIQWIVSPFLLAVVGFLFYRPSLNYAFQFDDLANITKSYGIRSASLNSLFFANSRWISSWINAANYRMGANDPFAPYYFRLTNISVHLLTSVLLFYVFFLALKHLKPRSEHHIFFQRNAFVIALLSTCLFLLHPTQTQAVSYVIQGRLEGLVGLAIVSMSLVFLLWSRTKNIFFKTILVCALSTIAAFSCGTKEAAIVGPALLILLDWFFVAHGEWNSLKKRLWLHALIGSIVAFTFLYYLKPQLFIDILSFKRELPNNIGNTITASRTDTIRPLHYLISEFKVVVHYLWIFLWPFNISVDYDWKMVSSFWAPDCLFPFLLLAGIGVGIYRMLRRNNTNLFAFGLLWFFIAIAPRASIAASTELIADYKTYLSSIGFLFVIAASIVYVVLQIVRRTSYSTQLAPGHYLPAQMALLVLFSLPIGTATYQRNKVWRSGEEFWKNVLQNAPGRARAYNNYGVALSEKGDYAGAIPYFKKAADMDAIYPDPLNNLAVAHSVLGNYNEAIVVLKRSLQINPYYPEAYNNLASFFIQQKDYAQAEQMLDVALRLRPHYGKAFYNKGRVYAERAMATQDQKQQRELLELAWQQHKNACTIADFDNSLAGLNEYAKFSFQLQKYDEAIIALKTMLKIDPTLNDSLFALGNAYYFKQDFENARDAYQELAKRTPQDGRVLNNLGETLYQLGNYEASVQCLAKAVSANPNLFNTQLRMAEALSKLGKLGDAKKVLENLAMRNVPEPVKNAANLGLAQLSGKPLKGVTVG